MISMWTVSGVLLLLLLLRSQVMSDVQSSVDDEARRLHEGGPYRSPQLLREVHSLGPSLTSDALVCWAVLKNVVRSLDAGATRALISV